MTKTLAEMLDDTQDDFGGIGEPGLTGFAHCAGESTAMLRYSANFMACVDPAQEEAAGFVRWLEHNRTRFGLTENLFAQPEMARSRIAPVGPAGCRRWQVMHNAVMRRLVARDGRPRGIGFARHG